MKTNTIITILIILFVIAGLFVLGYITKGGTASSVQGINNSNKSNSLLSASEAFYDFGKISMKNGDVTAEFIINNPTDKDITVKTILTSCMCTSAFITKSDGGLNGPFKMAGMGYVPPANEIIKAGENRIIKTVFDPNAHGPAGIGNINRFITLTDDSGGTLQFEIKALVTP